MDAVINTPIGFLKITEQNGYITGIKEVVGNVYDESVSCSGVLRYAVKQIKAYFARELENFDFPVLMAGSDFQRSVWEACKNIPYGETRTYSDIANIIGNPDAVRAVGMALKGNPILLAVPCHRVISKKGIGGFRLGADAKRVLFSIEDIKINI